MPENHIKCDCQVNGMAFELDLVLEQITLLRYSGHHPSITNFRLGCAATEGLNLTSLQQVQ